MNNTFSNTHTIIKAIRNGGAERQRALQQLYQQTPVRIRLQQYIKNNSGNVESAKDIFHDAMVVLDKNIRAEKFRAEGSLDGYLFAIGKLLWLKRLEKEGRTILQDQPVGIDKISLENTQNWIEQKEKSGILQKVMQLLGERCQKILELWKLSYSMEEIANELGFSSPAMARKNRYRCHQQLIKHLKAKPNLLKMLKES